MSTLITKIRVICGLYFSYRCCNIIKAAQEMRSIKGANMGVDYKLVGSRIKSARNRVGITQEALAEKLDVSIGYVSQVERGITKISLDLLASISAALNCDLAELVTGTAVDGEGYISKDLAQRIAALDGEKKKMLYDLLEVIGRW